MKSRQVRQVTRTRTNGKKYKAWIIDIKGLKMPDGSLVPQIKHKSPLQSSDGAQHYKDQVIQAVLLGKYDFKRKSIRVEGEPTKVKAPESTAPTVAAFEGTFVEWCQLEKQKPTYVETHESALRAHLLPLFGNVKLDAFGPEHEMALKRHLASRVKKDGSPKSSSRSTYNNQATAMNMLLKCAVLKKEVVAITHKFSIFPREEKHARYYDFDDYEAIVDAAHTISAKAHLIVLLAGDAGLRRGEILALDRLRVDFRAGTLNIEVAVSVVRTKDGSHKQVEHATKGFDRRSVPMTDRLMTALLAYPRDPRGPRLIHPDGDDSFVTDKVFKLWIQRVQKMVQTPHGVLASAKGQIHIFRHTFCSHLAMRGAEVGAIRVLAGHEKIETTQKYMHLARGETSRAIGLLNNRKVWVNELLASRGRQGPLLSKEQEK